MVKHLEAHENMRESRALLKILAQSSKSKSDGKFKEAEEAFEELDKRIEALSDSQLCAELFKE